MLESKGLKKSLQFSDAGGARAQLSELCLITVGDDVDSDVFLDDDQISRMLGGVLLNC